MSYSDSPAFEPRPGDRRRVPVVKYRPAERKLVSLENPGLVNLDMFQSKFDTVQPANIRTPDAPYRWPVDPSQKQLYQFGGYNPFHHGAQPCPGSVGTLPSQHAMDPRYDWNQQVMWHKTPGIRAKPKHLMAPAARAGGKEASSDMQQYKII